MIGRHPAYRDWAAAVVTFLITFSLGGCDKPDQIGGVTNEGDRLDDRIECRVGSATEFERFCTYEQGTSEDGQTLTLHKPDGGFRRLLVAGDGRGVVAADGAEPARVTIIDDDRIEVEIGGDSFRLPATVGSR